MARNIVHREVLSHFPRYITHHIMEIAMRYNTDSHYYINIGQKQNTCGQLHLLLIYFN